MATPNAIGAMRRRNRSYFVTSGGLARPALTAPRNPSQCSCASRAPRAEHGGRKLARRIARLDAFGMRFRALAAILFSASLSAGCAVRTQPYRFASPLLGQADVPPAWSGRNSDGRSPDARHADT